MSDIVTDLRTGRGPAEGKVRDAWVQAKMQEAADEIEKLRAVVNNLSDLAHKQIAENKRLRASLCADDQTLRLHLGEMTAQEMRTLRVGFRWAFRRAVLGEQKVSDGA